MGDTNSKNFFTIKQFTDNIFNCIFVNVQNKSKEMLNEFKSVMHDLQLAYSNLFRKDLLDYLQNFEFGKKFLT